MKWASCVGGQILLTTSSRSMTTVSFVQDHIQFHPERLWESRRLAGCFEVVWRAGKRICGSRCDYIQCSFVTISSAISTRWAPTCYKWVITPISRVITPVTHLQAIYRGEKNPFITGSGAHLVQFLFALLVGMSELFIEFSDPDVGWRCPKPPLGLTDWKHMWFCSRFTWFKACLKPCFRLLAKHIQNILNHIQYWVSIPYIMTESFYAILHELENWHFKTNSTCFCWRSF